MEPVGFEGHTSAPLAKYVRLLDLLAAKGPMTAGEIVSASGMARPTVYRLLANLETLGLVRRDPSGCVRLGLRLVRWGQAALDLDVVQVSRPIMAALHQETGESVQLYVPDGSVRVCVAAVDRGSGLRDTVPVGARLPLDRGSAGKVLRAFAAGGVPDADDAELATVRRRGFAESVAEREPGVASVSAPIRDPLGTVVAAICLSGPLSRLGPSPGARFAAAVVEAARRVEAAWARREG
jgi:DNA-binding IclR family transcriptional regulator